MALGAAYAAVRLVEYAQEAAAAIRSKAQAFAEGIPTIGAARAAALLESETLVANTAATLAAAEARVAQTRAMAVETGNAFALAAAEKMLTAQEAAVTEATFAHTAAIEAQKAVLAGSAAETGLLETALGALGGPIGLITGLLAAGATAWALWGDKAKEATDKAAAGAQSAYDHLLDKVRKLRAEQEVSSQRHGQTGGVTDERFANADADTLNRVAELRNAIDVLQRSYNETFEDPSKNIGGVMLGKFQAGIAAAKKELNDLARLQAEYDKLNPAYTPPKAPYRTDEQTKAAGAFLDEQRLKLAKEQFNLDEGSLALLKGGMLGALKDRLRLTQDEGAALDAYLPKGMTHVKLTQQEQLELGRLVKAYRR
jgi:hypothetical protein